MAVPADLTRKQTITIDYTKVGTGGLSDFSVLVTRAHLHADVVDPSGSAASRSDGGDVRFSSDAAGAFQLACAVISWGHDSVTGAGDAAIEVRVKVPSVSAVANTTIYIWYKGTTTVAQPAVGDPYGQYAAYDSGWAGHYPDGGGNDRTGNGIHLTGVGGISAGGATGKVRAATEHNGSSQYWTRTAPITTTPLSMTAWVRSDSATANQCVMTLCSNTQASINLHRIQINGAVAGDPCVAETIQATSESAATSSGYSVSTWHHIAAVFTSATSRTAYLDGANSGNNTGSKTPSVIDIMLLGVVYVDSSDVYAGYFDGLMDDAQLHSVARSAAWILTEYNQTNAPATFAAAGTPETVGGVTFRPEWAQGINTYIGVAA